MLLEKGVSSHSYMHYSKILSFNFIKKKLYSVFEYLKYFLNIKRSIRVTGAYILQVQMTK